MWKYVSLHPSPVYFILFSMSSFSLSCFCYHLSASWRSCLARTGPPFRMASKASAGDFLPEAGHTAGGKPAGHHFEQSNALGYYNCFRLVLSVHDLSNRVTCHKLCANFADIAWYSAPYIFTILYEYLHQLIISFQCFSPFRFCLQGTCLAQETSNEHPGTTEWIPLRKFGPRPSIGPWLCSTYPQFSLIVWDNIMGLPSVVLVVCKHFTNSGVLTRAY